jgi:hypothetical protein
MFDSGNTIVITCFRVGGKMFNQSLPGHSTFKIFPKRLQGIHDQLGRNITFPKAPAVRFHSRVYNCPGFGSPWRTLMHAIGDAVHNDFISGLFVGFLFCGHADFSVKLQ